MAFKEEDAREGEGKLQAGGEVLDKAREAEVEEP